MRFSLLSIFVHKINCYVGVANFMDLRTSIWMVIIQNMTLNRLAVIICIAQLKEATRKRRMI